MDTFFFILCNAHKYDILQAYHYTYGSLLWLFLFRLVRGKKSRTYLKLDADEAVTAFRVNTFRRRLGRRLMATIDLISVESEDLCDHLNANNSFGCPITCIPNGFYDHGRSSTAPAEKKRDMILTAGRLGTRQKATEIILEAFCRFHTQFPGWELVLAGPVESGFSAYWETFRKNHPACISSIRFTGEITDRRQMQDYYAQARMFVLASRWEGFPLVFPEAMQAGCYIVSTDLAAARDVTGNGTAGALVPVDDPAALARAFAKAAGDRELLARVAGVVRDRAYRYYYWPEIARKIDQALFHE
jgi:glycosyltransferase involved in cell wall biosynthesis